MKRVHILMGGPIRPTLGYIAKSIALIKRSLSDFAVTTHLVTWKTEMDSEKCEILNALFDNTYYIDEPCEKFILDRDIQTHQMRHELSGQEKINFIVGMYKLYYSYRNLVNMSRIGNDDIVIRMRTDLYIDPLGFLSISSILKSCEDNTIYIRPNRACGNLSDWFAISKYSTFKKTYYIENDEIFNTLTKMCYNSEEIVTKHASVNGVVVRFTDPGSLILRICREFKEGKEKLHSYD